MASHIDFDSSGSLMKIYILVPNVLNKNKKMIIFKHSFKWLRLTQKIKSVIIFWERKCQTLDGAKKGENGIVLIDVK